MLLEKDINHILILAKQKYLHVAKVYSLTRELADYIADDARILIKETLASRGAEMEKAMACDLDLENYLKKETAMDALVVIKMFKGDIADNEYAKLPEFSKITEQVKNMKLIWEKTLELDKGISVKLIGKDSFYK